MHVGIDITSLIYHRGVSRYTSNLALALSREPDIQLSLFGYTLRQKNDLEHFADTITTENKKILSLPQTIVEQLWKFGLLSVKKQLPKIELFHSWDWIQPPDKTIPIVSTIHDLAILKFPETAHPQIVSAHQRSWDVLKKNKSHLIAVSRTTKKDIVELLGYPSYMVHVVHEALPQEFRITSGSVTQESEQHIVAQLKLDKPYILFVGTQEPRKNLARLIQAWQPFAKDIELLVVGETGWDHSQQVSKQLTFQPRFLGKVSDQTLSVLYANAELFAYPSLYEGFGLPILESFHHGTPVLTSNNSGMLEVAGNACELVDPHSVESITTGIATILNEPLGEQQKRLQRMIIRQQMFNWKKVATETVAVYNQALADFNL